MERAIDRLPAPAHIREKKIIVTARSRTGTLSLFKALTILGYKTYHGAEVMRRGVPHLEIFEEALGAKYMGIGKPYSRPELDKWLADYDAIVEIPSVLLEEFVNAYPQAKILHLDRDVDKWYASVMNTVYYPINAVERWPLRYLRWIDTFTDRFCSFHLMVKRVWWHGHELDDGEKVLKEDYLGLSRRVKALGLPPDRFASFRLEEGFGWDQLCPFLGVPVPDVPYPSANTPERFDEMQAGFVKAALWKAKMLATTAIVIPGIAVGAWYCFKGR
ncbi:hypothetical protein P3342_007202 [Pyrenophora teres f. teres]|uniref:Uncharacterized protein n=1 Tax=Pyrenophora teres f. teres (strain 0-1) TaxID=861557 RepID=E3RJG1_PYRTT|nr:hypothetical protein PTT_08285 [Pyrenophora teres f. teres 0-1]KAK1913956.1 hypothetical protein P3342_007202 [Pyrenophora teres f. teres]